jgi:hypothetical protein
MGQDKSHLHLRALLSFMQIKGLVSKIELLRLFS